MSGQTGTNESVEGHKEFKPDLNAKTCALGVPAMERGLNPFSDFVKKKNVHVATCVLKSA